MEDKESSSCVNVSLNDVETIEDKEDELKVGMLFNSYDELFYFYLTYSKKYGFAICKRSCRKDDNDEVRYVTLTCAREGKARRSSNKQINIHPVSKTGCKARITATVLPDEKWRINSVILDHNHELNTPSKSRFYRCNKVMQPHVKRRLELNDKAGIKMNKSFNSLVVEGGGHENLTFQEKDCRNYIDKVRRLKLGDGDATAIHNYFLKMQFDNSDFFYTMDLDHKGRLRNVFWADARSRAAFKEFGDVVTFDTTYLTNKYDMPFAPFVGVNHHGQSVLLGCGLVSNEDVQTFTWLFQSWLACMHGIPPAAIITDQDKDMKKAIEIVFPNVRHRWCLWHIMKKLPEKFITHKKYKVIKSCMKSVVYDSLTIVEFEERWFRFIVECDLKDNEWLCGLYEDRSRWVPTFVKDTFWAGMSTTQRSESMNSFFKDYVTAKTSLKQFVEQYENALRCKVEKENNANFKSFNSWLPCITDYEMEKQFQTEYTTTKFKEFQQELTGKIRCNYSHCAEGFDNIIKYDVGEDVSIRDQIRRCYFNVRYNKETQDVDCSCRLFQFRGIICRHSLTVLIELKIYNISKKYILKRWIKLEKRSHIKVKIGYSGWSLKPESIRFDKMCKAFYEVAEIATDSDDGCNKVIAWIDELKNSLTTMSIGSSKFVPKNNTVVDGTPNKKKNTLLLSPIARRSKGRPPTTRRKSVIEKIGMKKSKKKKQSPPTQETFKKSQAEGTSQFGTSYNFRGFEHISKDFQGINTYTFGHPNAVQGYGQYNTGFQTQGTHDAGQLHMFQGYKQPNMDFFTQGSSGFEKSNVFGEYIDLSVDPRVKENRNFGQHLMVQDFGQPNTVQGFGSVQKELGIINQKELYNTKSACLFGETSNSGSEEVRRYLP